MVFGKADGFVHKRGQLHGMVVAVVVLLFVDNLSVFRHSNGTDVGAGFDMQYARRVCFFFVRVVFLFADVLSVKLQNYFFCVSAQKIYIENQGDAPETSAFCRGDDAIVCEGCCESRGVRRGKK